MDRLELFFADTVDRIRETYEMLLARTGAAPEVHSLALFSYHLLLWLQDFIGQGVASGGAELFLNSEKYEQLSSLVDKKDFDGWVDFHRNFVGLG